MQGQWAKVKKNIYMFFEVFSDMKTDGVFSFSAVQVDTSSINTHDTSYFLYWIDSERHEQLCHWGSLTGKTHFCKSI